MEQSVLGLFESLGQEKSVNPESLLIKQFENIDLIVRLVEPRYKV